MAKKQLIKPEKTDEAVFQAFRKLIMLHNLDCITVADIIAEAGIHRSTFYAHFEDKYDLAKTYMKTGIVGINKVMNDFINLPTGYRLDAEIAFFRLLKENRDMLYVAISHIGESLTFDCLEEATYEIISTIIDIDHLPDDLNYEITMQALTGSMVGVTKWWVHTGMQLSPEALAKQHYDIYMKILAR